MKLNDIVMRAEDRPVTAALVLAFSDGAKEHAAPFDPDLWALIEYEEGGQGWWPLTDLLPDQG